MAAIMRGIDEDHNGQLRRIQEDEDEEDHIVAGLGQIQFVNGMPDQTFAAGPRVKQSQRYHTVACPFFIISDPE